MSIARLGALQRGGFDVSQESRFYRTCADACVVHHPGTGWAQGDPLSFFLDTFESFASVGQFFAGPLSGNQQAVTSLQVTNRDPNQAECEIGILTHHGVVIPSEFPVLINDVAGPFASAIIPRGGVMRFDLTSSQFVQGAIALVFGHCRQRPAMPAPFELRPRP